MHQRNVPLHHATKVWGFTFRDLAQLFGVSIPSARNMVSNGDFDPADLQSICLCWYERMRSQQVASYDVMTQGRRVRFNLSFEPEPMPKKDDENKHQR